MGHLSPIVRSATNVYNVCHPAVSYLTVQNPMGSVRTIPKQQGRIITKSTVLDDHREKGGGMRPRSGVIRDSKSPGHLRTDRHTEEDDDV